MNEQTAAIMASDPLVGDFARPFPKLLRRKDSKIASSFKRMAELIASADRAGLVQFTISSGQEEKAWCLSLAPDSCSASAGMTEHPNLEIITSEDTWLEIANGRISPLEAFGQGRMRVRGDIALARFVARKIQPQDND